MLLITVGVNSEDPIGLDIVGSVFTGFDNRLVLLTSVKTVSVVIFCAVDMGILVKSWVMPVLLAVNPAGKDVVFNNDPFEEYTFITALIFCPISVGSDTE